MEVSMPVSMPIWAIILIVVAAILIILTIAGIGYKNSFVVLMNQVEEAFATMDVYLKKRWDLIPNLVETVKGYAKHEKETFKDVINLRNSGYTKMSSDEKIAANQQLQQGIARIMALAENYPELKASENFKDLNLQLSEAEKDISNARKFYNGAVKNYNNKVQMFPGCIFAAVFGYHKKEMFSIAANERENVKVKF